MKFIQIEQAEVVCGNCKHFHQHYVRFGKYGGFAAANAGHCAHPRIKARKPGQEGCEKFETKEQ